MNIHYTVDKDPLLLRNKMIAVIKDLINKTDQNRLHTILIPPYERFGLFLLSFLRNGHFLQSVNIHKILNIYLQLEIFTQEYNKQVFIRISNR